MPRFRLFTLLRLMTVIAVLSFYWNQWRVTRPVYLNQKVNRLRDEQNYDAMAATARLFVHLYPENDVARQVSLESNYVLRIVRHAKMLRNTAPCDTPYYAGQPRCPECHNYCAAPLVQENGFRCQIVE